MTTPHVTSLIRFKFGRPDGTRRQGRRNAFVTNSGEAVR
jgi:hypothetical protein